MALKKCSEDIENWSAGKLAALYINSFIASRSDSSETSRLEHITDVLSNREFKERVIIHAHIKCAISSFVAGEDYENASLYRDMLLHYNMHVLG